MKFFSYLLPAMAMAAPLLERSSESRSDMQLFNDWTPQETATLVLENRSPKSKPSTKTKVQPPKATPPNTKAPTTPEQTPKIPLKPTSKVPSVQPTMTNTAVSMKESSMSKSSSAKPTSTKADYVCGVGCGTKGCPIKAKPTGQSKPDKPGKVTRSLKDVTTLGRQSHVMDTMTNNQKDELDWSINGATAVSKHGTFGSAPLTAWVTGIEGCTGIAVVSEHGYWLAHFIESAMEEGQTAEWNKLINVAKNGDSAKKPPPYNSQVRYTVPSTLTNIFGTGSSPKIYLMKPKRGNTNLHTAKIDEIMKHIKEGILSNAPVKEFDYEKPQAAEKDMISRTTARGKILIEYDNDQKVAGTTQTPQKAKSRVWMETNPYENDWAANTNQLNGAPQEPGDQPESSGPTLAEFRKTCSSEQRDALTNDEADAAITAFCDARAIKLQPGTSKDVDALGKAFKLEAKWSQVQTGCNTGAGLKQLTKSQCTSQFKKALQQCPNSVGTGFMGLKPVTWNSPLGCIDFTSRAI